MSFNLNEEVINGHLVTAETKKLWAVEMDIAQRLLDVCNKHNLKIWAAAGTMLGAVRHHGFIPWDDDMDFCMMRDDYNKLIEIGPIEFQEPFFFQSFYTDKYFWGGMVKVRHSNTAVIEKNHERFNNFHRGIFIDVFVLDAIPDSNKEFQKIYSRVRFYRRLLSNYRLLNNKRLPLPAKIRHAAISFLFKLIDPLLIQRRIVSLLSKNKIDNNRFCGAIDYSASEARDIFQIPFSDKHCYDETIMLPFHNMLVPVPKGYNILLTDIYGDYMKPVKGGQAHTTMLVDCERSYKDVIKELNEN